jgi:hypothetical protein
MYDVVSIAAVVEISQSRRRNINSIVMKISFRCEESSPVKCSKIIEDYPLALLAFAPEITSVAFPWRSLESE